MKKNDIRLMFAKIGYKISFRKVSFLDLARDWAYSAKVTNELGEVYFGIHTKEHQQLHQPAFDLVAMIRSKKMQVEEKHILFS